MDQEKLCHEEKNALLFPSRINRINLFQSRREAKEETHSSWNLVEDGTPLPSPSRGDWFLVPWPPGWMEEVPYGVPIL